MASNGHRRLRLRRSARGLSSVALVGALTTCGVIYAASTAGASGSSTAPIVVGGQGDAALIQGGAASVSAGFEARIARFNKAGGLDGRKIKYLGFLDDALSPTNSLNDSAKLVEDDHVMVVAPFYSQVATVASGTFFTQHKVPFIGYAASPAFGGNSWGFGVTGDQTNPNLEGTEDFRELIIGTGQKSPADVKLAIPANDTPGAIIVDKAFAVVAEHLGIKVVYDQAPIPVTGTISYAPYASAIVSSGANAVYILTSAPTATALAAALKAAGFKGTVFDGTSYDPGQLGSDPSEEAALQGLDVIQYMPAGANHSPATVQAQKDLKAIGASTLLSTGEAVGYWSADILIQGLEKDAKKVGAAKVNSVNLDSAMAKGFTYTGLSGSISPLTFPKDASQPKGCWTLLQVKGAQFVQKTPMLCGPNINISTSSS
jgi:ABC-type branched-subunit amino acid transport system substrate-binding protein